jgi:hypothetical protein
MPPNNLTISNLIMSDFGHNANPGSFTASFIAGLMLAGKLSKRQK